MIIKLKQYESEKQKNDLCLKSQIAKADEDEKNKVDKLLGSYKNQLKTKCVQKASELEDNDDNPSCDFRDNMEENRISKYDFDGLSQNQ